MDEQIGVRIDRWLWAARFFRTRSLAKSAVAGGKVYVDDPVSYTHLTLPTTPYV